MEQSTLAHYCFENIRQKIVAGELLPGKKLAVVALSKDLKVGPTPVREALSRLTNTGLVEVLENKGFRVSAFSEEEIRDLYQTYSEIDCLALELSIERGDDLWVSEIVAALYQLSLIEKQSSIKPNQFSLWRERNQQFHTALANGCKSPCLLKIRHQLSLQFDRYLQFAFQKDQKVILRDRGEHKAIAAATIKRDKEKAITLLKAHSLEGMDMVIQNLKSKKMI